MKRGLGFWLDPRTSTLYSVVTHNEWLLESHNQVTIGLSPKQVSVLESLDPVKEIDEIRMVGVMFGLVRVRNYHRHLSIQFFAPPKDVPVRLAAIDAALPKLFPSVEHFLQMHNLFDDASARLWSPEFSRRLKAGDPVLEPCREAMPYNEALRNKMNRLMNGE